MDGTPLRALSRDCFDMVPLTSVLVAGPQCLQPDILATRAFGYPLYREASPPDTEVEEAQKHAELFGGVYTLISGIAPGSVEVPVALQAAMQDALLGVLQSAPHTLDLIRVEDGERCLPPRPCSCHQSV